MKTIFLSLCILSYISFTLASTVEYSTVDIQTPINPIKQALLDRKLLSTSFNCTDSADCNYKGSCSRDGTSCICNGGWVTHDSPDLGCNYEQKKQLTAFLLSFFLGVFAAGQWYVENYALAGPKLAIGVIQYCVFGKFKSDDGKDKKSTLCSVLIGLAVFAWWLADVIIFGMNDHTDGDGVDLAPW